jgi:hypothetical protein
MRIAKRLPVGAATAGKAYYQWQALDEGLHTIYHQLQLRLPHSNAASDKIPAYTLEMNITDPLLAPGRERGRV